MVASTWYPVIDYSLCTECGSCITKCAHGVYKREKAPVPVIQVPDACIDHCHGCGSLCPVGAITYLGEDTDWVSPLGTSPADTSDCGCSCGGGCENAAGEAQGVRTGARDSATNDDAAHKNTVTIEYLYLDLTSCERCIGTDQVLEDVIATLAPALELAGYQVTYRKIEMASAELAIRYRFLSSPTIRVNGRDIATRVEENHCGCCSALSGSDVDCRIFAYEGITYEVPPKQMLANGIVHAVFANVSTQQEKAKYQLPKNLVDFYAGKEKKKCKCGGDCNQ